MTDYKNGVSVIIPTIRNDLWLDMAVDSVLANQDANFEVIVVFDGVTNEGSNEWRTNPRVKIVELPVRSGQASAMSAGLEIARYPNFARLDADDLSGPQRLAKQLAYLRKHPKVVAVGTRVCRIDECGKSLGELNSVSTQVDIRRQLLMRNVIAHSSLMARTSVIDEIGLYRNDMDQMEDYEFILRLGLAGEIHIVDSVETYYRLHQNQISRKFKSRGHSVKLVVNTKKALAHKLQISRIETLYIISLWKFAEFLRAAGLRKPRYLTRLSADKRTSTKLLNVDNE